MRNFVAVLVAAVFLLVINQATAAGFSYPASSIKSLDNGLVCDKEKDKSKKKKAVDDEEPECD